MSGSPLAGIRVLDAASFVAGPLAAALLGDFGADVVKLESTAGDPLRSIGGPIGERMSATFAFANRGKRSVAFDLASADARERVAPLVESADVVIHNQRPAAERLRLDAGAVVVEISAFGRDGPYAGRQALDPIVQAMSGIVALSGDPEGTPVRAAAPVVDITTAMTAAFAALAALRERERSGERQRMTVSLFEVGLMLNAPAFAMRSIRDAPLERLGNASHALLADQLAAADGLVWLALWDRRQWTALCELLGLDALAADDAYATNQGRVDAQEEILPIIAGAAAGWRAEALQAALETAGIPAAITFSLEEAIEDEHARAVDAFSNEPRLGNAALAYPTGPLRLNDERPEPGRQAPRIGEHTDEVISELRT